MQQLSGVLCALWTPTNSAGEILWDQINPHLNFLTKAGIHGVMALGSTAEFPHLSLAQRKEILERLVRTDLPVVANVSHVSHRKAIELSQHAKKVGAAASAVLPPWFFPMAQRDLALFLITISKESAMPLVLYNFPEVTGKKIELETIQRVAGAVPVLAVKQSGGDFAYHHDLLQLGKEMGFAVLTGADTRLEEALQLGCAGAVSGLANAVPESLCNTYGNFQRGHESPVEAQFLAKLGTYMGRVEFPLNVKAAIAARGFETGALKNPASEETLHRYDSLLKDLRSFYASSGLAPVK